MSAWTGFPISLWIAAVGAFLGALTGIVGSELSFASALNIEVGVGLLGAVLGAIVGAVGGLLLIDLYFLDHLPQLGGALISGAAIAIGLLALFTHGEPGLMRLRGYREPSRREKARLYPLLLDAGQRMGLAVVPPLWISDSLKPGAWAHMRSIVVTRGLLGNYDASEAPPTPELDRAALSAVLAHELHHWNQGDVVGSAAVLACFWPVVIVLNVMAWIRQRSEWVGLLGWLALWPAWVTSRFVVVPLMARSCRRYEYEADARAASLGDDYRLGLRRALTVLAAWERPRTGWESVLAATHPPIELRLQRLEAPRE